MIKSQSLIRRLSLLKFTMSEARLYMADKSDEYRFSMGISILHDTVENLFWTIEMEKKIGIGDRQSFPAKFDTLLKIGKKIITFDRASIIELNAIRNAYTHQGILPNTTSSLPIIEKVIEDTEKTVKNIFKIELQNVSLSMLIKKDAVRESIQVVEENIRKKFDFAAYKKALYDIGKIYFDFHEQSQLDSILSMIEDRQAKEAGKKLSRYKFPKKGLNELHMDLLELGMVPFFYHRFKNLVPEFGRDNETDSVVPKYESLYWAKENWTKLNVEFCLNWIIEFFLKKQWLYSETKYKVILQTSRLHILKAKNDFKLELHEGKKNHISTFELSFKKDEYYLGDFIEYVEGRWQDYENQEENATLIIYSDDTTYSGQVSKDIFEIKEIHLDDLPKGVYSQLTKNIIAKKISER